MQTLQSPFHQDDSRIVADPVHGQVKLPAFINFLIDQPEFQRLRNISQMGLTQFVYPSACHNRFQHSIGTFHLSKQLLDCLKRKEKLRKYIEKKDELCVWTAALYHDIGHGPFSHFWDNIFMKRQRLERSKTVSTHEEMSVRIVRYLFQKESFQDFMRQYDFGDLEIRKIEAMIQGVPIQKYMDRLLPSERVPLPENETQKDFLYMIISNKDAGIDVDKWDYLQRDSLHIFGTSFEIPVDRFNENISFRKENSVWKMEIPFKEYINLTMIFIHRHHLHRRVCKHKTVWAIEYMLYDALRYNETIKDYYELTVSDDIQNFLEMDDGIFWNLLWHGTEQTRKIIKSILHRQLYKLGGIAYISADKYYVNLNEMAKKLAIMSHVPMNCFSLSDATFDWAAKGTDPLKNVIIANKNGEAIDQTTMSDMIKISGTPENEVRMYVNNDVESSLLAKNFTELFSRKGFRILKSYKTVESIHDA